MTPLPDKNMNYIKQFALTHVGLILAVGIVFAIVSYLFVPGWVHEWQAERHEKVQTELKKAEVELKTEADKTATEGDIATVDAQKSEVALKKTQKTIIEKKKNVTKLKKKSTAVGTRTIDTSDLPSDVDLCARAVSLGVRCDIH